MMSNKLTYKKVYVNSKGEQNYPCSGCQKGSWSFVCVLFHQRQRFNVSWLLWRR